MGTTNRRERSVNHPRVRTYAPFFPKPHEGLSARKRDVHSMAFRRREEYAGFGEKTYDRDDLLLNDGWERDQIEVKREVELEKEDSVSICWFFPACLPSYFPLILPLSFSSPIHPTTVYILILIPASPPCSFTYRACQQRQRNSLLSTSHLDIDIKSSSENYIDSIFEM